MRRQKRILIVEDDLQARLGLQKLMKSIGYDAEGTADWLDALHLMKEERFDLAIIDMILSNRERRSVNGVDLVPLLRILNPKVSIVLVTGQGEEHLRAVAMERGATVFLEKPVEPGRLTRIVQQLLAQATDPERFPLDR